MDAYLTAADLARIFHVSLSTVRRWAREDSWRRKPGRPCLYSCADAQASYEKRHVNLLRNRLVRRHQDTIDHIAGRP